MLNRFRSPAATSSAGTATRLGRRDLTLRGRWAMRDLRRRDAVAGKGILPRWWQRLRSLIVLPVLVVALGVALAATIGLVLLGVLLGVQSLAG